MKHFFFISLLSCIMICTTLNAQSLQQNLWETNGVVWCITFDQGTNTIYIGGLFSGVRQAGGTSYTTRNNIAAFDAESGEVKNWDPNVNGSVRTITISDSIVYIGGQFSAVDEQTRNSIAAINKLSSDLTDWNPNANSDVLAIVTSDSVVYAGGQFSTIGGQTRNYIAAFNKLSGDITNWDPNIDGTVQAMAISGSVIYIGGAFTMFSGQSRNHAAAIDITSGYLTDWNPNTNGNIRSISISGSTVYIGGDFSYVNYDQTRNFIAAVDMITGTLTGWNPNANGNVFHLESSGSIVYAAGGFTNIGGQFRLFCAAIDPAGQATAWNPNLNGPPLAIDISFTNAKLYLGGAFTSILGQSRQGFAGLDNVNDPNLSIPAPTNLIAVADTFKVDLTWTDKSNNENGFIIERKDDSLHIPAPWTFVDSIGMDVTSYTDMGVIPNSTYSYRIYAYNNIGNSVHSNSVEVTTLASALTTFQLSVNVTLGWNMVSAPGLHPTDQNVDTWWAHRTGTVWGFNGTQYVARTVTTPGEGYWMKNTVAETYNYPAITIVPHNPIPATLGWNMLGGYETSPTITALKVANPQITGTVWGYNGTQYIAATNLVPGYGYWVKVNATGNITIPDALAKGNEVVELFKEDWGRIVLTDAAGLSYTLYSVKGEVDLSQYEMPPLPPAGIFDIRYSSGRIAEDINSSMQTIDMTGITYPLTVRVEGMDIRLQDATGKALNQNLKSGEDVVISDATIQKLMVTSELIPTVYALEQNYPNPFNPSTMIEFSLPEDVGNVKLSIYNALGEKVAELVNTSLTAGKYSYQWNAQNVATGMYIYELRTDKFVSVKKMMLLK